MAKIHTLKVSNFRGIQSFNQVFGFNDFVCIIGRGDSGKTSILEAISAVLSPSWNLTFYDTDFYNADVEKQIEIEASLYDIPPKLMQESKFGMYIRGVDKSTNIIHDELDDSHQIVLTIKLVVDKELEPKWYVVNERLNQEPIEIRASDRASLNVFLISDYIDRHFSWSKGTPLYSLLKEDEVEHEKTNVVIDAFRQAKEKIDNHHFVQLDKVLNRINNAIKTLGVSSEEINTTIDFKDISLKDGRVCLHEDKIPFRLKGKGSKRLISIAIQMELSNNRGIILIDEIEQGLEPDRVKHLVRTFKENGTGQVFVTTHSRDVLVELNAESLFLMSKGSQEMQVFDNSFQACLRANPEAFFAKKLIVCEGKTEYGICRAIDRFVSRRYSLGNATSGNVLVEGNGSNFIDYSQKFKSVGFEVCVFCDSDEETVNTKKSDLIKSSIVIVDCEANKSIEQQLFSDLSWESVVELLNYAIEVKSFEAVRDHIMKHNGYVKFETISELTDTMDNRVAFGSAAKKYSWYKRIDHGEFLGTVLCEDYFKNNLFGRLQKQFVELSTWMLND